MKFLLTSDGLTNDALAAALEELVEKPLSETSVLFVTTAANTFADDKRWMIAEIKQFEQYNFKSIDLIDFAGLPKDMWQLHFDPVDVICVGGGDERYLAREMENAGMKEYLELVLTKKVYMGISAGSMVLGSFLPLQLTKAIFIEEDFGDLEGQALEFLPFSYVPHLNSTFFSLRKERLDGMKDQFTNTVYATDDYTGIKVVDGVITKVGSGEFLSFE